MFLPIPDRILPGFQALTPALLKESGIRCLLSDIDNTLVTYDDARPTGELLAWLSSLKENGITVIFLSNNNEARVSLFAEGLGFAYYAKARKPFAKKARLALSQAGFAPEESALLGDQLFTDIWAGKALHLAATFLVPPIRDKKSLFVRAKRLLEKPFLSCYKRREAKKTEKNGQ